MGGAQARDVVLLTRFFETEIDGAFQGPLDSLDREFKECLVFAWNQALQSLRKTGWSEQTLEEVGKICFRLHQLLKAYKLKKKTYTAAEWLEQVISLGKEMSKVTGA